jgi:gamma-glutamyltranspeptidase/glutathione hydrolase
VIDDPSGRRRATRVPGNHPHVRLAIAAWQAALGEMFEPAIRLARDGYQLTPRGREAVRKWRRGAAPDAWARAHYLDATAAKPVGTSSAIPNCRLLRSRPARPDAFYTGPIADGSSAR